MNAAPQYGLARALLARTKLAGGSLRINGGRIHAKGVPALLLAELKAHRAEVITLLTDPMTDTPPPKPITRAVLRFTLREGGGSILGQEGDTTDTLLDALRDKWSDDLVGVWSGTERIFHPQIQREPT